jgi:hypothetical protein
MMDRNLSKQLGRHEEVVAAFIERDADLPLTLLERLPELSFAGQDRLLRRLYQSITVGSHATQNTWRGRFIDLDEILAVEIRSAFPLDQAVHVHDMAASSSITSMELFERLSRDRGNVSVHASDFFDRLYIVLSPHGRWQVVFNSALEPMQFVSGKWAISAARQETNLARRILARWLKATELPSALQTLISTLHGPKDGKSTGCVKEISLFDPRSRELARTDGRFTLGKDDLCASSAEPAHVIRLMMHSIHRWSDSQLSLAIKSIHRVLLDDGILVIGAMPKEGVTDATIFRRSTSGFVTIKDIGDGSIQRSTIERFRVGC